jgi:hypothetical protein
VTGAVFDTHAFMWYVAGTIRTLGLRTLHVRQSYALVATQAVPFPESGYRDRLTTAESIPPISLQGRSRQRGAGALW